MKHLILAIVLSISGCMSLKEGLGTGYNRLGSQYYLGTRAWASSTTSWYLWPVMLIDMPLCFVFDTGLAPFVSLHYALEDQ